MAATTVSISLCKAGGRGIETEIISTSARLNGVRARPSSLFLGSGVHCSFSSALIKDLRPPCSRQSVQAAVRRKNLIVRGLFGLGVPELAVIAGVAALLFGPKKLPEIGKSLGKTVKSFQQAAKEFESEIKIGSSEPVASEPPKTEPPTTTVSSTPTSDKENP